ncbi:uncharacterized protein PAC_16469 [Phialocephala subalpina]|uniref:Uncharacterized protein n=1 Tax=Phialocephala subalpina TaxID=576137 RepID=A0A1L7XNG7_9HELO|nr:uncharacterized protein PAC_16469 [Phialocephala subalpina]
MENSSSSTSQGSLLPSGWHKLQDPLSKKDYFYREGTQISQWTDPELGVIQQYPTPRASDLIGSKRKRIQDVLDRMDQRSWVGSSGMEILRQKQQIAATFSLSAFGPFVLDVPDIVTQFADLVHILERDREATMIRHIALANFIEDKLLFIRSAALGPLLWARQRVFEAASEAWDAAHHIAKNMPPPPIDVQSHLQSSRLAINDPDLDHSSDTLTRVNSTHASISPPAHLNDEGGDSSLDPEASALETHSNCSLTEHAPRQTRKRKRSTHKVPKQKDPAKFKHQCDFPNCGERFTRSTTLREHERIHSGERPFACSVCGMEFPRSKDRNRHQKIHTGGEEYLCGISTATRESWGCGKNFARKDQLAAHLRTQGGWRCIAPMLHDQDLRKHLMEKAGNGSGYCCQVSNNACQARFDEFDELATHLKDIANKSCMADFLVKRALVMGRVDRGMESDKLGTFYETKGQDQHSQIHTSDSGQHQSLLRETTNPESPLKSVCVAIDRMTSRCPLLTCASERVGFVGKHELTSHMTEVHDTEPCPLSHCGEELWPKTGNTAEHIRCLHGRLECPLESCKATVSHFFGVEYLQHLILEHKMKPELAKKALAVVWNRVKILRHEDIIGEHEVSDCSDCCWNGAK